MDYFSANDFFQLSDNNVPLQTKAAIKNLVAPFESLFPDSRVPKNKDVALPFLSIPPIRRPKQPGMLFYKKDWIQWVLWEVDLRLMLAVRFLNLSSLLSQSSHPPPIILFLREFRGVSHIADCDIISMTGGDSSDVKLRERIEKTFPECNVFWIPNPADAISYSFTESVNQNSYPCFVSQDWLEYVKMIAKSADLIVMANTSSAKFLDLEVELELAPRESLSSSRDGVKKEIALLKDYDLVDKTFFCDAEEVKPLLGSVRTIDELTRDCISGEAVGNYDDILDLPPAPHWLGPDSIEYAGNFIGAIDCIWGYAHDMGKRRMTGDVIAALFMAMGTLAVVRGELGTAAELYLDLANMIQRLPDSFIPTDAIAEEALRKSAEWYRDNAELFSIVYQLRFESPN